LAKLKLRIGEFDRSHPDIKCEVLLVDGVKLGCGRGCVERSQAYSACVVSYVSCGTFVLQTQHENNDSLHAGWNVLSREHHTVPYRAHVLRRLLLAQQNGTAAPLPGGRTCDSRDRGSRHPSSMHVTLNVHVKREDLLKEDAAVLRRCVVDAFSPRPHDPTGTKERARHSGGNAMMLIAMCLSSAVSGSGSELRLAASCLTALLSQY